MAVDEGIEGPEHIQLCRRLGVEVPSLEAAATRSRDLFAAARAELGPSLPDDVDALVFGSLARLEASNLSDFDYLIVTREPLPNADALGELDREIRNVLIERLQLKAPGPSGLFGTWVAAADLYMRIGLDHDTHDSGR